jgi:ABC-type glycerol-3-phosphate transport system substrate-binding protein
MKASILGILVVGFLLAGCGGLTSSLTGNLIPKPTPTPALTVVPAALTMKISGATSQQTITASEAGQTFFTAESTNVAVATVATVNGSSNAFMVSAIKAGSCQIDVTDENGQTSTVNVTVTN